MSASDEAEVKAALARNQRYLQEFIEALAICPYARSCRETGRLHREVLLDSAPDADKLAAYIVGLETRAAPEIEVGLLIMPRVKMEARDFERFVSQVQRIYQQGQQSKNVPTGFFVVAFHP